MGRIYTLYHDLQFRKEMGQPEDMMRLSARTYRALKVVWETTMEPVKRPIEDSKTDG